MAALAPQRARHRRVADADFLSAQDQNVAPVERVPLPWLGIIFFLIIGTCCRFAGARREWCTEMHHLARPFEGEASKRCV